jgi:hypothetical protein
MIITGRATLRWNMLDILRMAGLPDTSKPSVCDFASPTPHAFTRESPKNMSRVTNKRQLDRILSGRYNSFAYQDFSSMFTFLDKFGAGHNSCVYQMFLDNDILRYFILKRRIDAIQNYGDGRDVARSLSEFLLSFSTCSGSLEIFSEF